MSGSPSPSSLPPSTPPFPASSLPLPTDFTLCGAQVLPVPPPDHVFDLPPCTCAGACDPDECECAEKGSSLWEGFLYRPHATTAVPVLTPLLIAYERKRAGVVSSGWDPTVYECCSSCACPPACSNRVTQAVDAMGVSTLLTGRLELFDRGLIVGLGLRASVPLVCGQFVLEYVGEVLTRAEEAARRQAADRSAGRRNYILTCTEHYGDGSSSRVYIDARSFGGLCRFVNHSCGPNLVALPVRADSSLPRVCFFAACDVPAGAELCIDFGDGKWSPPDPLPADLSALVRCLCGTELCKGFLPMSVTGEEGEGQEG